MINAPTLITLMFGLFAAMIAAMGLVTKLLGDRISDLGLSVNSRLGGIETRMGALEGAVRDVGNRLTVLETDLGKHQ